MSLLSSLFKKPMAAIENRIAAAKNEVKAEVAVVLAKLIILIVIAFAFFIAIGLASIGLSIYINYQLDHPFMGYIWVGVGYLIFALIIIALNKTGAIKGIVRGYTDKVVFKK